MLGSVEILTMPFNLFKGVGSGVKMFFLSPLEGWRNDELFAGQSIHSSSLFLSFLFSFFFFLFSYLSSFIGISHGTQGLVRKPIGAVFDTAHVIIS